MRTHVPTSGHERVHATLIRSTASTIDIFTRFQAGLRLGRPRRHRVGLAAEEEGAPLQLGPLRQHLSGQVSSLRRRHAHRLHEQGRPGKVGKVIELFFCHLHSSRLLCRFDWPSSARRASAGPRRNSLSTAGRSTRPRSSETRRTASSPAARTASSFTSTSGNRGPTSS